MTLEKKREVVIPVWLISVLAPVLLTVVGYAIGIASVYGRTEADMDHIKQDIDMKASKESVTLMQGTLTRIENKLDEHIQMQTN